MKRSIICFIFFLLSVWAFSQAVADVFMSMPGRIAPALSSVNKADLIDFRKSGMKAVVTNSLDYKVEMLQLTDTYMSVNTSSAGNLQLKLLPLNDTIKVVCLVRTVCPKSCLSNISFYSTEWKKLDTEHFFSTPEIMCFMKSQDSISVDSVRHSSLSDIRLFRFDLSAEESKLSISITAKDYVTDEENAYLNRLLTDKPVVMVWKDGRFELE